MPSLVKPLTAIQAKNAKPKEKPYKLADGKGMYLLVNPNGSKYWRMKTRFEGKEINLVFGVYPDVTLEMARDQRAKAIALKLSGLNPAQVKRAEKIRKSISSTNDFESIARQWHANKVDTVTERTSKNNITRLENDVFRQIGKYPIEDLDAPIMLSVLKEKERKGSLEMVSRLSQLCSQVFRYAAASGFKVVDPMPLLRGALKQRVKGHHAAITPDELPAFLMALQKNEGRMFVPTRILIRLMMMTFLRTSELTETPWTEIDLENEQWVIPWSRMKMGKRKMNPIKVNHQVNLPKQGWSLLRELHTVTGNSKYLFPNQRDHEKPASNGVILAALKRMEYQGKHTGHGFRSLAMGIIKERLNYRHEVVDRQLSHMSGDTYGEAYDRAEFKEERKRMMQDFADYIDLIEQTKVISARFGHAA